MTLFALAIVIYIALLAIIAIACEKYTALVGIGGLLVLIATFSWLR